jgi:hypothetical protein
MLTLTACAKSGNGGHSLGPRFDQATGSTFQGFSAGSTELAIV